MTQMTTPSSLVLAFVTLLATIGPIETAVIFIAVTHAVHKPERKRLAARSTMIASIMLVAFALIGARCWTISMCRCRRSASRAASCCSCRR